MDAFSELADGYKWLILGMALAIGEIFVPGVLLIWFSAAAVIVGLATLLFGFGIATQLAFATVISLATVTLGRMWYRKHKVASEDPLLNNRGARMIGRTVTVVEPVSETGGRAKVGDSVWPARGAAMAAGDTGRIIAVEDGVLVLQALD
ncbi:MAG: NfeD family protein [Pseudomonadota bacterium]